MYFDSPFQRAQSSVAAWLCVPGPVLRQTVMEV